jgi:hypothetical protein
MPGREVAALVSFSSHVSKLYTLTKWPVWLQIIPSFEVRAVVRFLQADEMGQNDSHHRYNKCHVTSNKARHS